MEEPGFGQSGLGPVFVARLLELRDRPEAKVAVLLDLKEVEHHEDSRFALSLDHYLESWLGDRPREIFPLGSARLLVLAPLETRSALETGAAALIHVLRHHGFGSAHASVFDLTSEMPRLLGEVLPGSESARPRAATGPAPVPSAMLGRLLEVERTLHGADVEALLREETVWSFADPAAPERTMTELAVSLEELEARLEVALRRNDWLRHEVAAMLDRGVLRHIARDRWRSNRRFSVDLHVPTVLDERFTDLVRAIPAEARRTLTVELASWELGLDAGRFAEAASRLADFGFAVAIDRVPLEALSTVDLGPLDRAGIEVAYVKAAWSRRQSPNAVERLRGGVARFGAERLILWHCTVPAALQVGQEAGATLFQGNAADRAAEQAASAGPPEAAEDRPRREPDEDVGAGEEVAGEGEPGERTAEEPRPGFFARLFRRGE